MATVSDPSGDAVSLARHRGRVWLARHYWNAPTPPAFAAVRRFMDSLRDTDGTSLAREALRTQPVYQLWTAESLAALAAWLTRRGARRILEVGAGDGRLTHWLQPLVPQAMFVATDDGSWHITGSHRLADVRPASVETALRRHAPDTVLSSWMPYRVDWTPAFRATASVARYVLIGEGEWGCVGTHAAWQAQRGWRRERLEDFSEAAWCRTDYSMGPRLVQHAQAWTWRQMPQGKPPARHPQTRI